MINRRRFYFIKKKFQLRYFLINLLFMFFGALIVGYTVYSTGWPLFEEQLSRVCPQGFLTGQLKFINRVLVLRILLLMPIIAVVSLFLSHRIAGPLYRLEHSLLKEIVEKLNLTLQIKLRKKDELKDLAEAINKVINKFAESVSQNRTNLQRAIHLLSELETAVSEGPLDINKVRGILEKLKEQAKENEKYLSRYQV